MMSVLFPEPRSRAHLKKASAGFGVGIENGAAIERERERILEAVDRISGSRNNGKREGKAAGALLLARWIH